MKLIYMTILSLVSMTTLSVFANSSFTNIALLENKSVLAAVKVVEPEMEMISHLVLVNPDIMNAQKISLPGEFSGREIVGLFPAEKNSILVVSQVTQGGGDKPLVHSYDISKKIWKKISEVDCISFAQIKVTKKELIFSCEETSDLGIVKTVSKAVHVDSSPTHLGEVSLPVVSAKIKDLEVSLEGEKFNWNKLKISKGKVQKSFSP